MAYNFFLLIIGIVVADFKISELLKYYNNIWRKKPVPEELKDVYSNEKYLKYQQYKRESYRFSVILSASSLVLTIAMLYVGFAFIDTQIRDLVANDIIISIVFFAIIGVASDLFTTPFDVYETFVIEQKYGFNNTTLNTYLIDKLKSYMLAAVVGMPILYLIIWLYDKFGVDFWWMAWIVISALSFLMSLLYSDVVVPIFNKQTQLNDGDLKNSIEKLSKTAGFNLDKVFIIDGSKRSTRANAYFTGFGSKKRIVLFDTLIKTHTIDEIVSVLAHEMGHNKMNHTIKGLIFSILQTGLLLFLFSLIIESRLIYEALGTVPGFHIGVIVFVILYSPVSFLLSFGTNYISRKYEFQADRYASDYTSVESLISALEKLTSNNMSDLTPHKWYVKAYYSHPPLLERFKALVKAKSI